MHLYLHNLIFSEYNPTYVLPFYPGFSNTKTIHFILRKFANMNRKDVCVNNGEEKKTENELSSINFL